MAGPATTTDPALAEATESDFTAISDALDAGDHARAKQIVEGLHHADIADLLERLPGPQRHELIEILRPTVDPLILAELDDTIREKVIERLGVEEIAGIVAGLETDDAVDIVEELGEKTQGEILDALPDTERSLIEQGLTYPEDSAGRLMQRALVAVPQHWNVGQAIDHLREESGTPTDFYVAYLVDAAHRPVGYVPLSRLLISHRHVALNAIMHADMTVIPVATDQEEVAFLFRQRDLVSAPVVDAGGRLVGRITIDDVVDVIHEEAEEDIMHLGGVGGEDDFYSAVFDTSRRRAVWLAVHLCAVLVGSAVIGLFRASIQEMVALAILMPIVAALGGTAGIQTLTVTVRAIAMRELTSANALRLIGKEVLVGGFNGLLFALVVGAIAWLWFDDPMLGLVIGMAMVANLLIAGVAGSAIPFVLERVGVDPAIASSPFLISLTDVMGFYVFLGLATVILL